MYYFSEGDKELKRKVHDSESELSDEELEDLKSYQISTKVLESSSINKGDAQVQKLVSTPAPIEELDPKITKKQIEDELLEKHGALASLVLAENRKQKFSRNQ